uniref:Uncharacterized protein n=1 Tax=Plectus sambesii TaxID=2011161 RepID=A0A914VV09_9BILA
MASLLHNMNLEVLKLPLGFIRVVQI